jgi:hypothetical protein
MTETARPPRRRLSKRALRAWAWVAGAATFVSPAVALAVQPKPATAAHAPTRAPRRAVVVRKITRRVIVTQPARPSGVRYVVVGGGSSSSSSSGGGSASQPPAPASATTTGGS